MPFGAGLLDLLSQGGQFLQGRQAGQRDRAIEDEKRKQEAALQQALLEYRTAQTEHEKALAGRGPDIRYVTGPDNKLVAEGPGVEVRGQTPQYVISPDNKLVPEGPGVEVRPPAPPSIQYVIGPDNKLHQEGEGVDVRPPTSSSGGLSGVTQKKALALYTTAKDGYERLENILGEADQKAPGWLEQQSAKLPIGIGNIATTPYVRQMNQAANQLSEGWLRLTSGAAITPTEVEDFALTFKPLAGDQQDEKTLGYKSDGRKTIIEAMRIAAGAGLDAETVQGGLAAAGIDPRDIDGVAAWIKANASGVAPSGVVPGASGGTTKTREQRMIESQGVR